MNLSQRLDQARTERHEGAVPDSGPTVFDLRMSRDAPVYDGTHLRTGEHMTTDRWEELRDEPEDDGLPAWKPNRANDLVTIDLRIDITGPMDAGVLDLRDHQPDTDDVFEMPAWATGTQVFRSEAD